MISNLKKIGLKIYAFTINSEEQFQKAKNLALNGIFLSIKST